MEKVPNIRHMAALAATVRYGSLTRAARAVNLTQPALTQAIGRLERQMGCTLFERGGGGMTPTEPATLLAPRAERAIERIGSPRVTGTQLRAFVAVARAGSFTGAAEATGLSAASLHRAVADLSLALGQRLVQRRGRQIILTPAGRRRQRDFGIALAELRSGRDEVDAWLGQRGGRIVIGAMPLSRARWLPQAMLQFARAFPQVDLAVIEGSYSEMAGPLRDGDIDMLLGALRDGAEDLEQQPVFEDAPKLIVRRDHPMVGRRSANGAELALYPWILPSAETPLRRYWEAMIGAVASEIPHVATECGSVLTTRQLLLGSDAITLLSPDQLAVEIEAGLLAVIDPPVPVVRTIGITTRRDWMPTAAQAGLIELLRSA